MSNCLTPSPVAINNTTHLRVIRDEEAAPYDGRQSSPSREWRPMLPPDLLCPEIGPDGIAVYAALCTFIDRTTGECWPTQTTIAERLGIGRKRVLSTIKVLEQHGFVEVSKRPGMKRSDLYRLPHQINSVVSNTDNRCVKTGQHVVSNRDTELTIIEPTTKRTDVTPLPPKGKEAPTYSEEFEAFWKQYPKGHGSKKVSFDEWRKLKPDPDTQLDIVAALAKWNACDQWQRGFVVYAERFLKRRMWEDDPPPPKPDVVHGSPRKTAAQENMDMLKRIAKEGYR